MRTLPAEDAEPVDRCVGRWGLSTQRADAILLRGVGPKQGKGGCGGGRRGLHEPLARRSIPVKPASARASGRGLHRRNSNRTGKQQARAFAADYTSSLTTPLAWPPWKSLGKGMPIRSII